MSIPDNPFQPPISTSPPVLQTEATSADDRQIISSGINDVSGGLMPSGSPHSHTSPLPGSASPRPALSNLQQLGGGVKTPRRVQWTSHPHVVQLQPTEPAHASPHTLDSSNIEEFRDALERHQYGAAGTTGARRRPPSQLSRQSSASESVTHQGTDDEEDYDYRTDVDPPMRPSIERHDTDETTYEANLIDNGMRGHVFEYIAPGETDGLPNIPQMANEDQQDAARDLVRAHTGKWGVLRRRVRGAGAVKGALSAAASNRKRDDKEEEQEKRRSGEHDRESQEAFAARYPEPGRSSSAGGFGGGPLPGGASVLSSLLALYGQQNGQHSGNTSAASSRRGSEDDYSSGDEQSYQKGGRHAWRNIGRRSADEGLPAFAVHDQPHPSNVQAPLVSEGSLDPSDPTSPTSAGFGPNSGPDSEYSRSQSGYNGTLGSPGFKGFFQRAKEQLQYHRPDAAKNAGGVFGALIQNTQNLSGAATPAGSTLAPAAKRPGYQLNRYSLPDVGADTRRGPWRPPSRPGSVAGSRGDSRPASIHSSTAVSGNDDSPKDDNGNPFGGKKAISSDDLMSMRKANESTLSLGRKRPKTGLHLESLAHLPVAAVKGGGKQIKNAEKWLLHGKTSLGTPPEKGGPDYFSRPLTEDERRRKEWEAEKKKRKKAREARKKQEIFIIQHVAAILNRQQFLLKLARALMMFGSPSHRLETQIQATAKVLEINCQVVYLPGTMLVSFGDDATHTSETKFLKQSTGLDLGKLQATHHLYWNVVHDKMSVDQASKDLDVLMTTPVYYTWWQTLIIGAFCSAFITVLSFYGSFVDALMSVVLGATLVGVQMLAARNDMFSNVFEIAIATLISFVAAALGSTHVFCYTALVSGGVVLILPGYIVLSGALELASRNITAGAVRIGYSVIYSLFLGFGISMGAVIYSKITQKDVNFLCAPGFSLGLSLRNQQPLWAKELPVMVIIACAGWTCNHFSSLAFPGRSDLTSAIGSFVVGTLGNIYGRFSHGSSFPVTVPGILIQLPSGLSNGGIFNFAAESSSGSSTAYSDGFSVAEQLVSVAIGLTAHSVGLFVSAAVCHPFGGGRRRGSGIFAF
ncbi:hypothetical protein I314_00965 [Cryptococcus bacillisporus CA1873]|uniref:Pheromone-regulated membrane protein 10 n=1 Tax=Cryptococcus bacillisporus CA1873 TaxID=1296111 RepID=A0ABR5BHA7_CRYGA|nr:hypothetical protein I314_00965 [Cryptococcus bacillisporus CA1873]|eukprot:KIR68544.1 hypothetical protein I314_00965 [Cryptococcus gattii CA1873]